MNTGRTVFSQLIDFLPERTFSRYVRRYDGERHVRTFSCWDQFLCLAFAQLTFRESLRDTVICLRALGGKLYHSGIRGHLSHSTFADANEKRDWRIYADFAQVLIKKARELYQSESLCIELENTTYAFDSTTVDLCLSLFPWAQFRRRKSAVKLHTLIDLRGNIPCFIHITSGRVSDVKALDHLPLEPGAFYIMDRGYMDFARLYRFTEAAAFFVIRAKGNLDFARRSYRKVDRSTGLRSDQTIVLAGPKSSTLYPDPLRRVAFYATDINKRFVFLTNNLTLPAITIAQLYKCRWQVELFFDGLSLCTPMYVIAFQGLADSNWLFAGPLANGVFQGRHPHLLCAKSKAHYCTPALPANVLRVSFSVSSWQLLPRLQRFHWWLIRRGFAFRLLGKRKCHDCGEPNIPFSHSMFGYEQCGAPYG